MNEKSDKTYIIWLIGGIYLLYLTIKLSKSIMNGALGMQACVFPVLFGIAGIVLIVKGIRRMKNERKLSETPENEETTKEELEI